MGQTRLKSGEKYDPNSDTWKEISDMQVGRSTSGVGVLNDQIFIIGGFDGEGIVSSTESYNDKTDSW